jgi:competence CoiA-like predicted nuclease
MSSLKSTCPFCGSPYILGLERCPHCAHRIAPVSSISRPEEESGPHLRILRQKVSQRSVLLGSTARPPR